LGIKYFDSFRSAEKEVAAFWSTLADESKSAILMVFLALLGRHLPRWLFQLLQLYGLSLRLVLLYGLFMKRL
jgi:hypothetical protein